MKKYKASTRGYIKYVLIGVLLMPIIIYFIDKPVFSEKPAILLPLLSPVAFVLWIYFDTYYKIDKGYLFYRSAFLRGKIEISAIKEIENNKTLWVGVKPALGTMGMVVKYNVYDEIYIAPENNLELIKDLLRVNSGIVVINK